MNKKIMECLINKAFHSLFINCGRWDLNPHSSKATRSLVLLVCQFRHFRMFGAICIAPTIDILLFFNTKVNKKFYFFKISFSGSANTTFLIRIREILCNFCFCYFCKCCKSFCIIDRHIS